MGTTKSSEEDPFLVRVLANLIGGTIITIGAVAIFWAIYIKNHWSDEGTRAGYFGIAFAATAVFVFIGGTIILELCEWAISSAYSQVKSKHSPPYR